MIGRRAFITGLVAFVAAPAIVRASSQEPERFRNEIFRCRVFDLRGKWQVSFSWCEFHDCKIIVDEKSKFIIIANCLMENTPIIDVERMRDDEVAIWGNVTIDIDPAATCEPTS